MPEDDLPTSASDAPGPWQKGMILAVGVLALAHIVLIAAWLAPAGPLRDQIGNTRLAAYVDPYFQQSWDRFDPNAQYVDEKLVFRAEVLDVTAHRTRTTSWTDVTAAEAPALTHSVLPARAHLINRRLATNLNAATFALNTKQRAIVAKDFVKSPAGRLSSRLNAVGAAPAVVANYVSYDAMTVQFLSMYANAKWGGQVLKVQYKVGRRTVTSFADRDKQASAYDYFAFGWRKAIPAQPDAQSGFDAYLKR